MSNAVEGGAAQQISNRFHLQENASSAATNYNFVSGTELRPARCFHTSGFPSRRYGYIFTLNVTVPSQTTTYNVQILRASNNSPLLDTDGTGSQTFTYEFTRDNYGENDIDVFININTDNTLGISQTLTVERGYRLSGGPFQYEQTGNYQKLATTDANTIVIANQMPKMKIFDFLKNIFTMFNLTAYKEDGIITVLPLDDYYNAGKVYDITEYVDTTKSKISKLLQFRNMIFNFKSKKSYLVQYSEELQGNIFAQESYGNDEWDGGDYKVEVDFEKMMYERLTDENTGNLTTIVQGAMLDKKFEPTIGLPLLFYCFSTVTNDALLFKNDDDTLDNINPYLRPSNSISNITTGFISQTLNFGIEVDEYTLGTGSSAQQNQSNDLFTKYYRNYVANLFARNSRKTSVSAYLPLSVILKYRLNDIFIIGTTEYRINSIKTNLLTNKSDLELYNLNVNTSQSLNGQSQNLQRVENLETTSKTSSSVSLQWDLITNANLLRYELYQNDEFVSNVDKTDNTKTPTLLDSDTTYKFSLRAIYDVDGEEAGAFDTDLFETTL